MDLEDFLTDHLDVRAYDQLNFFFWVRTVCAAMSFIGPETDADLERMIRLLLDHYAGEDVPAAVVDDVQHEIMRLRGATVWEDTSPLGLKYRCLNAIASSRDRNLKSYRDLYEWGYGVEIALQLINHSRDKDQALISFIRDRAREQGVELYEKHDENDASY